MSRQQRHSNRKIVRSEGAFLHHGVDDHSPLVYSEIFGDGFKELAGAFRERARELFAEHCIAAMRVITDNGSCYRSHALQDALGIGVKHKLTCPPPPQANGKAEKSGRTRPQNGLPLAPTGQSPNMPRLPA
ncbi:DDE-type integrase/transposase/recombinase [Flavimobilis sp. GY10621]|uniref:DDE-type integrase/transposase/recombinase n=1 Tax=Flavimobilis rhizosphaerae TaxID=2775421 RepID=A0ABR9DP59_9MICO|nr:DDE-type integrase/transposase/recombinase [Flavimobilis rhizosphaerae]MBD9698902.1 DDE-type integrase/transposase/recombinase [Flavimobilis rhizosphaerae]